MGEILSGGTREDIRGLMSEMEQDTGDEGAEFSDDAPADDAAGGEGTQDGNLDGEQDLGEDGSAEVDPNLAGQGEPEGAEEQAREGMPNRIRIGKFSAADQVALVAAGDWLAKNPGKSLEDALGAVGWKPKTGVAVEAAKPDGKRQDAASTEVAKPDYAKQIAEKRAAYSKANAEFNTEDAEKLHGELLDLVSEHASASAVERMESNQRAAAHEARVEEHWQSVTKVIPEITSEGSALHDAAQELSQMMPAAFFADPSWPNRIAALAWAQVNPDKPMPALRAAAAPKVNAPVTKPPGARPGVVPNNPAVRKPATPAAVLRTGNGARDDGGPVAKALRPGSTRAELAAAMTDLEK